MKHDHTALLTVTRRLEVKPDLPGSWRNDQTPEAVAAVCYTIATELAVTPLAYFLQVICVGFGNTLTGLDRIQVVDSIDDIIWLIEDTTEGSNGQGESDWNPIIVIDPSGTPPPAAQRLFNVARQHRPISAVVGYPAPTRWKLRLEAGAITLEPHGTTLSRRDLTTTERSGLAELLAATQALAGPTPLPTNIHTPDHGPNEQQLDVRPANTGVTAVPRLEVKVLGHIRVSGAPDFRLTRSAELVTYLALHRRGVDAHTLMEAIWPNQPTDKLRLNRHLSLTRTALGEDPEGGLYLPHIDNNLYRVSPHLTCDLDRFERLVAATRESLSDQERRAALRDALDLVENTPFTGVARGYTWAYTEGIVTRTVLAVDDTAHNLARLGLDDGDHALVTWASRKGLLAISGCEECYRNMMRSAAVHRNRAEIITLYKELETVTYADDGPNETGWLEPETQILFTQLTATVDSDLRT